MYNAPDEFENRIYIEGNNGGNFVEITQLDDNRVHLVVGDCCVKTIDIVLTAEIFSNFLTRVWFNNMSRYDMSFYEFVEANVSNEGGWVGEVRKKMFEGCKDNLTRE